MLSKSTRGPRLALALFLAMMGIGFHTHAAYAQGDDEDEEEEEEEDEDGGDEEEEENPEDDKDQPPITSGGLFTMETYPQREISRPLNLTQKLTQLRLGIGTDISAKGAFESFGVSLEAIHGYSDNFTIIGGFTSAYNFKQFGAYLGFEGALAYDLVNIRVAANIHRNALPQYDFFCNPPSTPGETAANQMDCGNGDATLDLLPNGSFNGGGIKFGIDIGFPFRYAIRPEIAIVALQTLMTIDFNSVDQDYVTVVNNEAFDPEMPDSGIPPLRSQVTGNGAKPDLNPSVGIATNPIAPVSIVIFGQLRIPDFDTSAGAFQIPVTGRVQFSPNQKFDIGMEFTLLNVKPPDGQSPIDNRYLSLFIQSRLGK